MLITQHLLFNFSILIGILFIHHLLTDRNGKKDSKFAWFSMLLVSLLVCFIFSLEVSQVFRYDLRIIPIVLAGLFFNMSWTFFFIAVSIRACLGIDDGFLMFVGVYFMLTMIIKIVHPWFIRQSTLPKILSAMFITFIAQLILILIRHQYVEGIWNMSLPFVIVPVIGISIFVYVIEYIRLTDHLKKEVFQSMKMNSLEHLGAAISHEIRNPLTSVKGFVQMVKEQPETSEQSHYYLKIAAEELDRAELVIQDYLTFTKPSLKEVIELNVSNEIKYVLEIIIPLANQHSVSILNNCYPVATIQGDREKFRQCLFNIVKNGIESMPKGGTITLNTQQSGNSTLITVQDTGVGMTLEQINRIGEPYYSTKEGNGTGLGMMVVRSIIKAMKGKMQIQSKKGMGTTITMAFPSSGQTNPLPQKEWDKGTGPLSH